MRAALVLCLSIFVAACGPLPAPAAVSQAASPARVASAPRIQQPPVTPPTPPGTDLPAFACADASGGTTGVANAVAARVAEQPGYDRFVLQFDSAVPSYTVKRQASPVFPYGASGQTITLSGTSGVLVDVQSATAANTFTGSTDLTHGEYLVLKEARQTQDFEGHLSWGLGLGKPACLRAFTLADPARLVVDFSTA
ncbi:MAG: AMIN-like domain-containing (lipo)protein [Candidatus Dormibacteraceae bacterium]